MHLRILSLNVWALPLGFARHPAPRMAALGERLMGLDVDVIALQEVWSAAARSELLAAGTDAGFVYQHFSDRTLANASLMILSRRPLIDPQLVRYRVRGRIERVEHADYYGHKGYLRFGLDTEAGRVDIVNTHLHASYAERGDLDDYLGERVGQATQLAHALRSAVPPVLCVGDFNMLDDSDEYRVWLGLSQMTDAAAALDERVPTMLANSPYRSRDAVDERIDYAFYRRGRELSIRTVSFERVLDETLSFDGKAGAYSDHCGVLASFEIEAIARPPRDEGRTATSPPPPWPAEPEAVELARSKLQRAARDANARALSQERTGLVAGSLSVLATAGVGAATRTRRSLFRIFALMAPAAVAGTAVASWVLGARFTRESVDSFRDVIGLLDDFELREP